MIKLPEKKAGVIASLAHSLLSLQETDRLSWERLLGHLAFAAQISPEMNLQKKLLGPILNKFGEDTEVVFLPKATLKILAWWSLPGNLQKWTPLRSPPPSLFLFTDACEKGWGGPRWPRKVGSRELGGRVSKPPYEYFGVKSSLSSTLQLSSPSRVFHQAFLGQFNNCPSHKETRVLSVVGGYLGSRRDFPSVSGEGALHRPLEDQGQSQCPCGCSVEGLSPSRGMGTGSIGQREGSEGLPRNRNRHYGNSLQCNSAEVCEPLLPPSSSSHRRMGSGLEPMGGHLLLPASFTSSASICESDVIQGQHDPSPERPPVSLHPSPSQALPRQGYASSSPPQTEGQGSLGTGWQTQVLSMDCVSLLRSHLRKKWGAALTERILKGKRDSTRAQNEVIWRSFQDFIRAISSNFPPDMEGLDLSVVSPALIMHFCVWLRTSRNLHSSTIANYKALISSVVLQVFNVDCSSWEFKALRSNFFLEKPPNPPRIPDWDIQKVLTHLDSGVYSSSSISLFAPLKKCLFLVALASGNRISEISSTMRTGIGTIDPNSPVRLAVAPGFLFKNQREGRTPPPIKIVPLGVTDSSLCPVANLASYLSMSLKERGPLFLNSKTGSPLHKSTISRLICEVIEEGDLGKLPKVHDVRVISTSLAWSRGLDPAEIAKRAFWRSSSIFIDRYLSDRSALDCVALNTVRGH